MTYRYLRIELDITVDEDAFADKLIKEADEIVGTEDLAAELAAAIESGAPGIWIDAVRKAWEPGEYHATAVHE